MSRRVGDEELEALERDASEYTERHRESGTPIPTHLVPVDLSALTDAIAELLDLREEVKRLREAIAAAKWPSDCLGAYCPWCENNPEEGHGEWRGGPCPAKEGGE